MAKRRTHSSIDKLPAGLKAAVTRMIVDNEWPEDFPHPADYDGNPRYEDIVTYLQLNGYTASLSSVGRYGMRMRTLSRMREAGAITREVMADLTDEKASQTQKAVAEMITAVCIEFVSGSETLDAKEIQKVAQAMRDCTAIAINSDKYIREQIKKKAADADKEITKIGKKTKLDPETLKMIREQIYGITG